MPGLSGIDLIQHLQKTHPGLPILILSMHNEGQIVTRALKAGATGYVTKGSEPEVLLAANSIPVLCLIGLLVGVTVAPTLINGNSLIGRLVTRDRLTEGLSWMGTGIGIGVAIGSSTSGVAIDHGGCFETSHATTHDDPIYEVDGIMHYCVANMPGAVARTSTIALGNATMPLLLALADKGWRTACAEDPHLLAGLNTHAGHLTYAAVGEALGIDVMDAKSALKA